jgi:aspartyl-tRNA(Asn)/glutamyl-tRNA(Gln) amidotransferase subunit C
MTLTREEVEHIALLARLDLSEDEIARYKQQLSAILDHIAQMQTLDTQNIQPTSSVLPPRTRLRSDEPHPGLSQVQALENAPDTKNHQFRVPPVLE